MNARHGLGWIWGALLVLTLVMVGCGDEEATPVGGGVQCRLHSDCAPGQRCESGACVEDVGCQGADCPCVSDASCEGGARCDLASRQCVPRECAIDRDCPLGEVCANGACVTDVLADRDRDGVPDGSADAPRDNCADVANTAQDDLDGDGLGDACDGDRDGDGVEDADDLCPTVADPGQADHDGDGQGDACEGDEDRDGVRDDLDVCPEIANPAQDDLDADGLGDLCDLDLDGDGVPNDDDNCPGRSNPEQRDEDEDGQGDACEGDFDSDGVRDDLDNCVVAANPRQDDLDGDEQGDVCDEDDDGDGVPDGLDNCSAAANADQRDGDSDGQGDACEGDSDADGVRDDLDNCPRHENPGQDDLDRDGLGDPCDVDRDGDDVNDLLDNCPDVSNPGQEDADGNGIGNACGGFEGEAVTGRLAPGSGPSPDFGQARLWLVGPGAQGEVITPLSDGTFRFPAREADVVGIYALQVRWPTWTVEATVFTVDLTTVTRALGDIEARYNGLVASESAPLFGQATLADRTTHEGIVVYVRASNDGALIARTETDERGAFTATVARDGTYALELARPGYLRWVLPGPYVWDGGAFVFEGQPPSAVLTPVPGSGTVRVWLGVGPSIVPQEERYGRVRLSGEGVEEVRERATAQAPNAPPLRFEGLPTGTYVLTAERAGFSTDTRVVVLREDGETVDATLALGLRSLAAARLSYSGVSLSAAHFEEAVGEGVDLTGGDLTGVRLTGADLSGVVGLDLTSATLANASLDGADLSGVRLRRARLFGATARGARFVGADLDGASFAFSDLADAVFSDPAMEDLSAVVPCESGMAGVRLLGASFSQATLRGARFGAVDLTGVELSGTSLVGTDFAAACLQDARLALSNLDGTVFRDARADRADLTLTGLQGADLEGLVARGAIFANAIVRDSRFNGALLTGANFAGALLERADFGCRGAVAPVRPCQDRLEGTPTLAPGAYVGLDVCDVTDPEDEYVLEATSSDFVHVTVSCHGMDHCDRLEVEIEGPEGPLGEVQTERTCGQGVPEVGPSDESSGDLAVDVHRWARSHTFQVFGDPRLPTERYHLRIRYDGNGDVNPNLRRRLPYALLIERTAADPPPGLRTHDRTGCADGRGLRTDLSGVNLQGTNIVGSAFGDAVLEGASLLGALVGDSQQLPPSCFDFDGDGVEDAVDVCWRVADADQQDTDADGVGDACEGDRDADGIADHLDNCPNTPNADQLDFDGDDEGDACEGMRPIRSGCTQPLDCRIGWVEPNACSFDKLVACANGHGTRCDRCAAVPASCRGLASSFVHADLADANLTNAAFSRTDLRFVRFDRARMQNTGLSRSWLQGGSFQASELENANLQGALLHGAQFIGSDLTTVHARRSRQEDTRYLAADLSGADLSESMLLTTRFESSDLGSATLAGSKLSGVVVAGSDLSGGDWSGVQAVAGRCEAPDVPPPAQDTDHDGFFDPADNCPGLFNITQSDYDGDGLGDACDDNKDNDECPDSGDNCLYAAFQLPATCDSPLWSSFCSSDNDGDGVFNVFDLCPWTPDPNRSNRDNDGQGDACDDDLDNDGAPNAVDNCLYMSNPSQADSDGDGIGDACQGDPDSDGVPTGVDNCEFVPNPTQENVCNGMVVENDACGAIPTRLSLHFVADPAPSFRGADIAGLTLGSSSAVEVDLREATVQGLDVEANMVRPELEGASVMCAELPSVYLGGIRELSQSTIVLDTGAIAWTDTHLIGVRFVSRDGQPFGELSVVSDGTRVEEVELPPASALTLALFDSEVLGLDLSDWNIVSFQAGNTPFAVRACEPGPGCPMEGVLRPRFDRSVIRGGGALGAYLTSFEQASFVDTQLVDLRMQTVYFRQPDFTRTRFSQVRIDTGFMESPNFTDADLRGLVLQDTQIVNPIFSANTICFDGRLQWQFPRCGL